MADGFTFEVPGLDTFLAELRTLPKAIQTKVVRGAVGTGASVLRQEVIRQAPVISGVTRNAVYQIRNVQRCTSTQEVFKVGVRKGKRFRHAGKTSSDVGPTQGTNRDAYYAAWVEYGHFARVPHEMSKTAKAAGRMLGVAKWVPPHPFFRPAIADKTDEAIEAMRKYFEEKLPLATAAMTYLKAA